MEKQTEIFKDIPNYEGLYQVSNLGRVKSLKRKWVTKDKILKHHIINTGYYAVSLFKENLRNKSFTVHQLMAITFLNHKACGYKMVVDHIDNNPLNNNISNLQVITHRENSSKDKKNTSSKYTGVTWHKRDKKWTSAIVVNKKNINIGYFENEYDAHLAYQKELNKLDNN